MLDALDPRAEYYHGELEITCGEYEFTYHYFVNAETYEEALQIMRDHAKEFYGGEASEDIPDVFFFHCGCVAVKYDCSANKNTIMTWMDYKYICHFLGKGKVRLEDNHE